VPEQKTQPQDLRALWLALLLVACDVCRTRYERAWDSSQRLVTTSRFRNHIVGATTRWAPKESQNTTANTVGRS
jgi:hypothetical protein